MEHIANEHRKRRTWHSQEFAEYAEMGPGLPVDDSGDCGLTAIYNISTLKYEFLD
jgi:hypothetical protein